MKKRQGKIGFFLSYLSILVSSIVGILFTPYMVSQLGADDYGLYQLLYATIGYVALLDFGLGSTLTRYILKYQYDNRDDLVQSAVTMCVKIYAFFGLLAFTMVCVLSNKLCVFFPSSISDENLEYAKTIFRLMGATTGISLVGHAMQGIETAYEKYIITKGVMISRQVMRVVIITILLNLGWGALAIVWADLVITCVLTVFDFVYCSFVLQVPVFRGKWNWSILASLFGYSFFVFMQTIITQVNNGLDRMILGRYTCLESVAIYGLVMQLFAVFNSVGGVVSGITIPQVSRVVFAKAPRDQLTDCCVQYSRFQLHISGFLLSGFLLFGVQFVSLWVKDYNPTDVYCILLLIVVPQILESVEGTIFNVMKAKNMQATRSVILFGVAIFNVIFTIALIQKYPLYGAALGTFVSFILGNTILSNIYYHKRVGVNMPRYFKKLFHGIAPAWIIASLLGLFVRMIPWSGWIGFLSKCVVYTALYGIIMLLLGINENEKRLVTGMLKKVGLKVKRI